MTQAPPRALRGQELSALVTGEGVLIDVPPASLLSRAVASIIDHALYLAIAIALFAAVPTAFPSASDAQLAILTVLTLVLYAIVLPAGVELATRGRSLGKLIMKLRIVRDDGGPIVFRHAFVRALVGVVEIGMLQGVPAVIAGLFSRRVKRLGDMAAGTYAVREETALRLSAAPTMPPQLASWAAHADLGRLPDELALSIRQFLCRPAPLTWEAEQQLGGSLLREVLPLVSPPPPPGAPGGQILAAVLVERSRRDWRRLQAAAALRERTLGPDPLAQVSSRK